MTDLRVARTADIPALNELIADSARSLSVGFYTPQETESAITYVFGVDTQLLADETYYVMERDRVFVACGGWSKRRTLFGGDQLKSGADPLLDPATEPARIRAFFVHPGAARQGLGTRLLRHCMNAAAAAGFRTIELAATLPGVPLYAAFGFTPIEETHVPLPDGVRLPIIRMGRALDQTSR
jgi:GNAT superfamily N-acetyltransferase